MRRALAVIALLAALLPPAGAAALEPPERDMLAAINAARAERGLSELRYEPRLARVAADVARASADGVARGDPRFDVAERLAERGYAYLAMRAFVHAGRRDAAAQVAAWLSGDDRRRPLLDRDFVEVGIAHIARPPQDGVREATDAADSGHIWGVVLAAPTAPAEAGWRARMIERVNAFRAEHGLIPLTGNRKLDRAAQAHADDMARRDFFAHRTPEGEGPAARVDETGYQWSRVLENLAAGQPTPREAVEGWKASKEGHREAMLDKEVREMGVGYRYLARDGGRLAVHHYWAVTFAAPR